MVLGFVLIGMKLFMLNWQNWNKSSKTTGTDSIYCQMEMKNNPKWPNFNKDLWERLR